MRSIIFLAFVMLQVSFKVSSTAQPFRMVKDINDSASYNSSASTFGQLTEIGGTLFFSAAVTSFGEELWRSDGTEAGTMLVKDISPGLNGSNPYYLTNVNGVLYFSATDPIHGDELWKSDGTAEGTVLVKDINEGTNSSDPGDFISVNGVLFFTANDISGTRKLWKSDGTTSGTIPLKDLSIHNASSEPHSMVNVDGVLYFSGYEPINGAEIWKSDGTTAGTLLVKDIRPGSNGSDPDYLTNLNGTLYFTAGDDQSGTELWKTDGTEAGTQRVKDINPGKEGSYLGNLTTANGTLYFNAYQSAYGYELWKSDGTPEGTVLVKDIYPGINSGCRGNMEEVDGVLFLNGNDAISGRELWKSDGTAAGTVLVKDINPGTASADLLEMTDMNGILFFRTNIPAYGWEMWKSDGTAEETALVKDIHPGNPGNHWGYFTSVGSLLFFIANDSTHSYQLWKSDGTIAGTQLVKIINAEGNSSNPINLTKLSPDAGGNFVCFNASNPDYGTELWISDGTSDGTVLIKDIYPGKMSSNPQELIESGLLVYFMANDSVHGVELWMSDGTPGGTVLVRDIGPGTTGGCYGGFVSTGASYSNDLYFKGADPAYGVELWYASVNDATMVADINPGSEGSSIQQLTISGQSLFFIAYHPWHGGELWRDNLDGRGPEPITDFNPGLSFDSQPSELTDVNGVLYFSAEDRDYAWGDPEYGRELWKAGPSGGATVIEINPGAAGSYPNNLTNVNGILYFSAYHSVHGRELWRSDGTIDGTRMVKDINPGTTNTELVNFTNVDGVLYFAANDPEHGTELWKSDGTEEGTVLVKDIQPGAAGGSISSLKSIRHRLLFTANNGINGEEVWISDGTSAGTVMVQDIVPGSGGSSPRDYTESGYNLFFVATTPEFGTELWTGTILDVFPVSKVELKGIQKENDINLEWTSFHEQGVEFFEVQRSTDGTNFTTIGEITAKGGVYATVSYNYTDSMVQQYRTPVLHYRLKIVNTDGRFKYSNVVNIEIEFVSKVELKGIQQVNDINLQWTSFHEQGLELFEVQRSTEGTYFTTIGQVPAKGGVYDTVSYNFTDFKVQQYRTPVLHYRLKIVDTDGEFKYSNVIHIEVQFDQSEVIIWPNPVQNQLELLFTLKENENIKLSLYDQQGKLIQQQQFQLDKGVQNKSLSLTAVSSGLYFLSIRGKEINQLFKLVKQ